MAKGTNMRESTNGPVDHNMSPFTTAESHSDRPVAISENGKPMTGSSPTVETSSPSMEAAAASFMDEYADVFGRLAR